MKYLKDNSRWIDINELNNIMSDLDEYISNMESGNNPELIWGKSVDSVSELDPLEDKIGTVSFVKENNQLYIFNNGWKPYSPKNINISEEEIQSLFDNVSE